MGLPSLAQATAKGAPTCDTLQCRTSHLCGTGFWREGKGSVDSSLEYNGVDSGEQGDGGVQQGGPGEQQGGPGQWTCVNRTLLLSWRRSVSLSKLVDFDLWGEQNTARQGA